MTASADDDVTGLLIQWSEGNAQARDHLVPLIYRELRTLAAQSMRAERGDHTLQPTALVHETWVRLIDQRRVQWKSRAHFFGAAAQIMRRILVDHARRHAVRRRDREQADSEPGEAALTQVEGVDVLALDTALEELAALDSTQARIVELRYFAGLSAEEAAEAMGVSRATLYREWDLAKAWLHRKLSAT
ncbi:MAG TPA: ECF-type sigma factor [Casimicrobiaceae bacterium]|nr:ECF-type sigma factor [Casimicrobiaceae bacterium]